MTVTTKYTAGTFVCPNFCSGDAASSKAFYSGLLGWQAEDMHMPEGDYTMYKVDGEMVAGMYQMPDDRKKAGVVPHWNSYLTVADVNATVKKATELGGKVLGEPFDAMGDLMANIQDPTGVKFSVWEAKKNPSDATRLNEMGALCWTELCTNDSAASSAFYSKLIGWKPKPFEGGPIPYTIFDLPDSDSGADCSGAMVGMLEITDEMQGLQPQWLPYFMVEDADKIASRAKDLGGQAHGPMDIPTVGRIVMINDTEGAAVAVIELADNAK